MSDYKVNVDKPTKTVTIHGPESPYGPDKKARHKQRDGAGNFGRDGGWFTGLLKEIAEAIAEGYRKKGYKVKRYK